MCETEGALFFVSFEARSSEVALGTCVPSKTGRRGSEWSKGKWC